MNHNPFYDDMPVPARPTLSNVARTILGTGALIALAYVVAGMLARIVQ